MNDVNTPFSPEELAEACIADMEGCTYRGRVDAIAAAIRGAVEAERKSNSKTAEATALRDFGRLPFGQFAFAQEVSMAAAKAIDPSRYPSTTSTEAAQ
ncbi:hypothetical protein TSH7_01400 [Azospirillum sp. TSH7]|uniref:hypothetical protein n=1 Tax=unclassified Azospirillum TaxID=2630922 RepID=UPI000D61B502|nr:MULTISPECIES: hypothetical protein [unclassified Azospirillum]PWC69128.1 hypothetical protein TSH7_01400 [Azospirillum sp. TSH7]PWC71380.1 hypothetical protein TSH20_03675 [Azospirillum sp. TSH20]